MATKSNDLPAGLLCIAVGVAFAVYAQVNLNMGTIFRMGAGYFPFILACLLVVLGAILSLRSIGKGYLRSSAPAWRGLLFLTLAPLLFGLSLEPLGFVPAVFLVVFISCFASPQMTIRLALLFAICMTALCVLIFYYALGVTVQLFGTWLI
jgi:hypothetical protein